jgi:hypothetical protein
LREQSHLYSENSLNITITIIITTIAINQPLARSFMLPAAEMGQKMHAGEIGLPPTPQEMPLVLAKKYVNKAIPEISSAKRVLRCVRAVCAMEIACEPRWVL